MNLRPLTNLITDHEIDALEQELVDLRGKPDRRKRHTLRLIERLRVAERAAANALQARVLQPQPVWDVAQHIALAELREEGRVR